MQTGSYCLTSLRQLFQHNLDPQSSHRQTASCRVKKLMKQMQVDFSGECRDQLAAQQQRRIKDWRMDYDLRLQCKSDVSSLCAGAKGDEDKDNAAIMKCLVDQIDALADSCAREVSRSVRNALQFYQPVPSSLQSPSAFPCGFSRFTHMLRSAAFHGRTINESCRPDKLTC